MREVTFDDYEIDTTLKTLNKLIDFMEKSDGKGGKFTAETIRLTRDTILKIKNF